jgi:two-component system sensor histidine kinase RstB
LDYLIYYPGQEEEYLKSIQTFFLSNQIEEVKDIWLDSEQIGRLRQDQSVMLYRDSASVRNHHFYCFSDAE